MAAQAKLEHNNFTAGELSPWLRNRTNLDRYAAGLALCRNFVLIPEGGVTRRPGSRMVLPLKIESQGGRLIPFRFSGSDSYMLVLNGGVMRFLRNGGFVLAGPTPYEIAIPWTAADLPNVRWAQEGNAAWLTCPGFEPRELRRFAHDNWTLSLYRPSGGPIEIQNVDQAKTIEASSMTGTVTLTSAGVSFTAGDVGSVWRLDESDLSLIANWKADEAITVPTEPLPVGTNFQIGFNNQGNAWDGVGGTSATRNGVGTAAMLGRSFVPATSIRQAQVNGDGLGTTAGLGLALYGRVGAAPVTTTDGVLLASLSLPGTIGVFSVALNSNNTTTEWDHLWIRTNNPSASVPSISTIVWSRFSAGGNVVLRRYNGNVYQAIAGSNAGVAPPVHTEGDVLSETGGMVWRYRHGPYGMARITAFTDAAHVTAEVIKTLPDSVVARATYRWWAGAWNAVDGWPEGVLLIDRGLLFWRGREFWMTTVDNLNDFEVTVLPDSAVAQALRSRDGALPDIEWALDNGVIVMGCRDNEIIVRAPQTFDPLTSSNIRAPPGSKKGSCPQVPAGLEDGAMFISRSRARLFYVAFDPDTQKLAPVETSISGRHLLERAHASEIAWQPDPWQVLWGCCQDGTLFGLTFSIEHKIAGMHSHALTNGFVEDVKAIPSSDEGVSEVYLIVRRVIDGVTRRFAEQLGSYFEGGSVPETMIAAAGGTIIGDMTAGTGLGAAFDGDIIETSAGLRAEKGAALNGYVGKTFATPLRITKVEAFPTTNNGFSTGVNVRITLYARRGTPPAHATDGTALGTTGMVADSLAVQTIVNSANGNTEWSHVWIALEPELIGPQTLWVTEVQFYTATPGAVGAWFFDSALEYSGAPATTISGLGHLVGQEVGILADYAAHPRKVVSAAGQVVLERPTARAVIGLPIDARIVDLPRNIALREGQSKGARKRASHALVDLVDTIGGSLSCNGGRFEDLALTGGSNYGAPPLLFTGMKRALMVGPLQDEAEVTLRAAEGMPMTITGLGPELDIVEE